MTRSLPRGTLLPEPLTRPSMALLQNTGRPPLPSETMTLASEVTRTPGERQEGSQATEGGQEDEEAAEEAMEGEGKLELHRSGPGEPSHEGDHSRYYHFSSTLVSSNTDCDTVASPSHPNSAIGFYGSH